MFKKLRVERFKELREERSEARPIGERDRFADHYGLQRGECPTSDHRRKVHKARAHARITVVTTYEGGGKTTTFIDQCKCQFCGHEWEQEWMPI